MTLSPENRVIVIGSANADLTSVTPTMPRLGETVLGSNFAVSCGGKGANQANAAARLGLLRCNRGGGDSSGVSMVCRVGPDAFGTAILDQFRANAVDFDTVATTVSTTDDDVPLSTGVATIWVDASRGGDNAIVVTPGANRALRPKDVRTALQSTRLTPSPNSDSDDTAVILVQLEVALDTALEALRTAQEQQQSTATATTAARRTVITILNPAPAPANASALDDFWPYVDILIPNQSELHKLCAGSKTNNSSTLSSTSCPKGEEEDDLMFKVEEQMARTLLDETGIRMAVIVTLGAHGALVVTKDGTTALRVSAPPSNSDQDPVVDTVGAGDAFCGALAAYLAATATTTTNTTTTKLSNWLGPAAIWACGCAGLSVRRPGTYFPTRDDLPESLRRFPVPGGGMLYDDVEETEESTPNNNNNSSVDDCVIQTGRPITFVTGNKNKLAEVQQILSQDGSFPLDIINQKIDLPELQGDVLEIAKEKCRLAVQQVRGPCFTEDTSLCFSALNGMPGPYIKWFLESCGHDGLNQMLAGFSDKSAYAQTVIAYSNGPPVVQNTNDTVAEEEDDIHIFVGRTSGKIVPPRGSLDFGWDPIFEPDEGNGLTYAEMRKDEKNAISHRGRSFSKLREFLLANTRYSS